MEIPTAVAAAVAAARTVEGRWGTASDEELLADGAGWEALGRLVDARRAGFAAEVEVRSHKRLGEDSLAFRYGHRDGVDLVAATARTSRADAVQRVGVGAALASTWSPLSGEELPGKHPALAAAVRDGDVGVASARAVVQMLRTVRRRADPAAMAAAEEALTGLAATAATEVVAEIAGVWAARLDPDGAEPTDSDRYLRRLLTIHRADSTGGSRFSGYLPAEERAILVTALAEHRKQTAVIRFPAGDDGNDGLGPEWRELDGEHRSTGQTDFDTLVGILTAGLRAESDGTIGSAAGKGIPELIVQITASELEARQGSGWISGALSRLSVASVERITCTGDLRLQVNGDGGEPLHLGRPRRRFSPAQRRALVATAGGCQWPGCTAPPVWCDVHHAAWYHRDDGPTDIDNGVLLCSFHHHHIHATDTRWRIVIHTNVPHLVPARWRGAPEPQHRMQRHPAAAIPHHDPWRTPPTT